MSTNVVPTTDLDSAELRKAFGAFPTGVVALAGISDTEPTVIVASSFAVGVSQEPPLVMFAVQQSSTTWPMLRNLPSLGVSVLGESHTDVIRQLSSKDKTQRFAGVGTTVLPSGGRCSSTTRRSISSAPSRVRTPQAITRSSCCG